MTRSAMASWCCGPFKACTFLFVEGFQWCITKATVQNGVCHRVWRSRIYLSIGWLEWEDVPIDYEMFGLESFILFGSVFD
jgi:hypothetical protein